MSDPDRRATMDVLTVLTTPALFTNLNFFRLVVFRMAAFSLEHGNTDGSCLAYVWLGGILGRYFGDYQAGLRFGELGLDLVENRGLDRLRARVYLAFAVHVAHWSQPLAACRVFLRRAFEAAREAGDLTYAAYSCSDLTANLLAAGAPLGDIEREAKDRARIRAAMCGSASSATSSSGSFRLIRTLRGLTPDFGSFDDAEFDEGRFEQTPGEQSPAGCRRVPLLDPQAAGLRLRRRPRICRGGRIESSIAALDGAHSNRAARLSFLRGTGSGGALRYDARRGAVQAFGGAGSPSRADRGLGGKRA